MISKEKKTAIMEEYARTPGGWRIESMERRK